MLPVLSWCIRVSAGAPRECRYTRQYASYTMQRVQRADYASEDIQWPIPVACNAQHACTCNPTPGLDWRA